MADRSKAYQIARRYASALFELLSPKEAQAFVDEAEAFQKAVEDSHDVREFLKNPLIERETKAAVIKKIFPNSVKMSTIDNFLGLICEKDRETILPEICEVFEEKLFESQGKALCVVTTARPISGAVVKSIQEKIKTQVKKDLVMKTKIDPGILGGFRAEVSGTVLDATVKAQLELMKQKILHSVKG